MAVLLPTHGAKAMKCIAQWSQKFGVLNDTVQRVPDDEAQEKTNTGDYAYVPKHVWKKAVRK